MEVERSFRAATVRERSCGGTRLRKASLNWPVLAGIAHFYVVYPRGDSAERERLVSCNGKSKFGL